MPENSEVFPQAITRHKRIGICFLANGRSRSMTGIDFQISWQLFQKAQRSGHFLLTAAKKIGAPAAAGKQRITTEQDIAVLDTAAALCVARRMINLSFFQK